MARSTTERLRERTSERQFLYELETDSELAPAASRAVLATAQQVLLASRGEPRQGQMRVTVVSVDEPSGKPMLDMGSSPTHKGIICRKFEEGMSPPDIARAHGTPWRRWTTIWVPTDA